MSGATLLHGLVCCYSGCDCENPTVGCKGSREFLCCVQESCLAVGEPSLGVGLVTNERNGEVCKLGIGCYSCGIKIPQVLCAGAGQCLCLVGAEAFPFHQDYLAEPVCGKCGLMCAPKVGCCEKAPPCHKLGHSVVPAAAPVASEMVERHTAFENHKPFKDVV